MRRKRALSLGCDGYAKGELDLEAEATGERARLMATMDAPVGHAPEAPDAGLHDRVGGYAHGQSHPIPALACIPATGILQRMTYTITLQDFPDIPEDTRVKAEDQYRRALEKALGGPDDVLPTYHAWLNVSESGNDELNADDTALANRWITASNLAKQAGFRSLGESDEAYFEFNLNR